MDIVTGSFYIDATDLTLPGPMPLHVRRNYSSQNLAENEFGFGWKINYVPFLTVATNSLVYAAEMDGTFMAYRQQAAPSNNVWAPTAADNPTLNNNSSAGVGSIATCSTIAFPLRPYGLTFIHSGAMEHTHIHSALLSNRLLRPARPYLEHVAGQSRPTSCVRVWQ